MNLLVDTSPLVMQLLVPLSIAVPVSRQLEPALRAVLIARSGCPESSDYWVRSLRVLWLSVPLVFVLVFSNEARWGADMVAALRQILGLSLIGVITSVLAVAWRLSRTLREFAVLSGGPKA